MERWRHGKVEKREWWTGGRVGRWRGGKVERMPKEVNAPNDTPPKKQVTLRWTGGKVMRWKGGKIDRGTKINT